MARLTGNQGYRVLQTDEEANIQLVIRSKITRRTLVHVHEAPSKLYRQLMEVSIESKVACSADLSHTDVLGNEKHDKGGPAYCCISPDTQICMLVLSEQVP